MYGHHVLDMFGYSCVDLRTLVLNAIGCIYHAFKYIRNVYDSVKFLSDVMSFISALGCSSSL